MKTADRQKIEIWFSKYCEEMKSRHETSLCNKCCIIFFYFKNRNLFIIIGCLDSFLNYFSLILKYIWYIQWTVEGSIKHIARKVFDLNDKKATTEAWKRFVGKLCRIWEPIKKSQILESICFQVGGEGI